MSTSDEIYEARVRLGQALFPLRQRALVVGLFCAVAIACLAAIAVIVVGMWIDLTVPLSVGLRRLVLPTAVLTALTIAWVIYKRFDHRAAERELALEVDRVSNAGGQVMTGYELVREASEAEAASGSTDASPVTRGLALMAANQAKEVCTRADEVAVVPAEPARYWWKAVGIAMVSLIVFACFLPRMAWTQAQRILVPSASQIPYSPTSISLEPGDTEVLFGSDLEVIATIDGPLVDDLELVRTFPDQSEERMPMLAETDQRWRTYMTRITEPSLYHVRGGSARSKSHSLRVRMTPQITSAKCKMVPPEYAKRSSYVGPIPQEGIEGLRGTRVEFTIESNRPLKSGSVAIELDVDQPPDAVPSMLSLLRDPSTPNRVTGDFTMSASGRFSISVIDEDETPSADPLEGVLRVLPDHAPVVRLLQPKIVSLATPDVALPIVIAAEDDHGIAEITLFRGLNGSPAMPKKIEIETADSTVKVSTALPLTSYGLEPGDEIMLFARVEDNDPDGAKGAESPVATVRIISREQLAQIELNKRGIESILSKQRQVQRMLASLQKQLQETIDANQSADQSDSQSESEEGSDQKDSATADQKAAEAMAAAAQAMREAAESVENLANHPMPVDVDQGMSEQLQEMAEQLSEAADRLEKLNEKMKSGQGLTESEKQELSELMDQLGAAKEQHQKQSMQPSESLAKTFPLAADEQRFSQLAKRQRSLAQRLDALQNENPTDPGVKRRADELRREQQQLQVQLSELLENIESHVRELPADPEFDKLRESASEFVKAVRSSQADPNMTSAQEELLDDQPGRAVEKARKAAEILESFLGQCNSMGQQACQNCQASFNPSAGCASLGDTIQQLLDGMGLGQQQSGMKPGMGAGMGRGGGNSMPQSTAENIGLYGGLPSPVTQPRSGNGEKSDGGVASYAQGGSASATGGSAASGEGTARGDAGAGVPSLYREQVSEYFRQLADELGDL